MQLPGRDTAWCVGDGLAALLTLDDLLSSSFDPDPEAFNLDAIEVVADDCGYEL